ncbi:sushi, nidogen and EGF-like domain-containing protein 1, partial [Terrapene carolina triunguis]|uniref:sushi, nidogen and EGF-like domain-containing protein 1 n=1 Tax=Terrapene triunguis TaxID=2587831 RepID=UPI000E77DEAB
LVLPAPVEMAEDSLLYPYGPAQGDQKNPKADDGASPEIPISMTFTFYGKEHRSLYVNNNGVVSFGVSVSQYTPDPFPLADGRPFVAPYWGDVNNNLGGDVYYRETQNPELLRRLTRDINQYFPEIPFTATWAFVATWDRVAYYGSTSQKVNTFQAVLANDGKVTFIMLNYGTIQWTTGTASRGDANNGLGGTPAQTTLMRTVWRPGPLESSAVQRQQLLLAQESPASAAAKQRQRQSPCMVEERTPRLCAAHGKLRAQPAARAARCPPRLLH